MVDHRFVKSVAEEQVDKAKLLIGPKPELAPNKILADLFGHPSFKSLKDFKTKELVINFFKVLNKRKI